MSKFKPNGRTVVLESRNFIVDSVTKSQVIRSTSSKFVPNEQPISNIDANVTEVIPYTLENFNNAFSVNSAEPVRIRFRRTSLTLVEEDEPVQNVEVKLSVPKVGKTGENVPIEVIDERLPLSADTLDVLCVNLTTFETEIITLHRAGTKFVGFLQLSLDSAYVSYDSKLYAATDHSIEVRYGTLTSNFALEPKYSSTIIKTNERVFPGNKISVMLLDKGLSGNQLGILRNSVTGEEKEIIITDAGNGVFAGSMNTVETVVPSVDSDTLGVYYGQQVHLVLQSSVYAAISTVNTPRESMNSIMHCPPISTGKIDVTLYDPIAKFSDNVSVAVSNSRTLEFETLDCEKVNDVGVFVGSLLFSSDAAPVEDGRLYVNNNDTLRVSYSDSISAQAGNVVLNDILSVVNEQSDVPPIVIPTDPEGNEHFLDIISTGTFSVIGKFIGVIQVFGVSASKTRCSILHS